MIQRFKGIDLTILVLLSIGFIGLFLPWANPGSESSYYYGYYSTSLIIFYTILFIIFFTSKSFYMWSSLIIMIGICIFSVVQFLTWHILNITGEIDINYSIQSVCIGFFITLVSTIIVIVICIKKLINNI
ncbi:hypothetical protein CLPU_9c00270 [Gottschalkia purinilytica]|uniref:Uncharacterized protein n=1 Tax=Gottschalkia purinilytica TaxID=1503 RepID=A0A0L0W9L1_GOTPU|nr:hypothetical protein [Gottschalkia purinilytica]KNF08131.1 hypothetical protein CLPU_9c00270 [Gottschalkia purinilytica]